MNFLVNSLHRPSEQTVDAILAQCSDHPHHARAERPAESICTKVAQEALATQTAMHEKVAHILPIEAKPVAYEYFRRVPRRERIAILLRIIRGNAFPSAEELEALKRCDFERAIFRHPEWPLFALAGLLRGDLSREATDRLLLYDASRLDTRSSWKPQGNCMKK